MVLSSRQEGERMNNQIHVDLQKLRENIALLRGVGAPYRRLMPAVKGDGYGLGAVEICRELNRIGIDFFCVATLEEAVALREAGIWGEILILGYTHADCAFELKQYDLIQTVVDLAHARALARTGNRLQVHLKLDTGMHRLGAPAQDKATIEQIASLQGIRISGAYTKLARCNSARAEDIAFSQQQIAQFEGALSVLRARGLAPTAHLGCTYAMLNYPDNYPLARPGAAIYGAVEQEHCFSDMPPFQSIFEFKTKIAQIVTVAEGDYIGYGVETRARRDMRVATLTSGYVDGLPRCLSNGAGRVLLHGASAPIIGIMCMDQTMIDVTDLPQARAQDEVTLIGRDGEEEITVHEVAQRAQTFGIEIMSRLGHRPERIYHNKSAEKRTQHQLLVGV